MILTITNTALVKVVTIMMIIIIININNSGWLLYSAKSFRQENSMRYHTPFTQIYKQA